MGAARGMPDTKRIVRRSCFLSCVLLLLDQNGQIARDEFGNALGGVRLPEMDVPTGSHNPPTNQADPNLPPFLQFLGNLACALSGSVSPFDQATLDTLYPDHDTYQSQVVESVNALKAQGLLLQSDAVSTITEAAQSGIGD